MIEAVARGAVEAVRELLDAGADVDERGERDWTALGCAAGRGDLEIVTLLLQRGADVTAIGKDLRTPRMIACAAGHLDVAAVLARCEEDLDVRQDAAPRGGFCRAYLLGQLRQFDGWSEGRKNWSTNPHWSDDLRAEFEKDLENDDVVYLQLDLTVTRSSTRGEHVVFDRWSLEWEAFCSERLGFRAPRAR